MGIYLGNVKINELEKRLECEFSDEDRIWLEEHRSDQCELAKHSFHIYDIPFCIITSEIECLKQITTIINRSHAKYSIRVLLDRPISEFIKEEFAKLPQSQNQHFVCDNAYTFVPEIPIFYRIEKENAKSYRVRLTYAKAYYFFKEIPQLLTIVYLPGDDASQYTLRVDKFAPHIRTLSGNCTLTRWSINDALTHLE